MTGPEGFVEPLVDNGVVVVDSGEVIAEALNIRLSSVKKAEVGNMADVAFDWDAGAFNG